VQKKKNSLQLQVTILHFMVLK